MLASQILSGQGGLPSRVRGYKSPHYPYFYALKACYSEGILVICQKLVANNGVRVCSEESQCQVASLPYSALAGHVTGCTRGARGTTPGPGLGVNETETNEFRVKSSEGTRTHTRRTRTQMIRCPY